ncbi:MAG: hypothetical protein PW792_11225 [Acidobacteriaceae bacterium]|nr:hypothetical protein [Acidobacteriaceae bacterium]
MSDLLTATQPQRADKENNLPHPRAHATLSPTVTISLGPKTAAKAFGVFLAIGAVVLLCFGGPGICGLTGGILTRLFPASAVVDGIGIFSFFACLFGLLLSLLWFLISGSIRLLGTRASSDSQ